MFEAFSAAFKFIFSRKFIVVLMWIFFSFFILVCLHIFVPDSIQEYLNNIHFPFVSFKTMTFISISGFSGCSLYLIFDDVKARIKARKIDDILNNLTGNELEIIRAYAESGKGVLSFEPNNKAVTSLLMKNIIYIQFGIGYSTEYGIDSTYLNRFRERITNAN